MLAIEGGTPVRSQKLPLHQPWFDHAETEAVIACLASSRVSGDGPRGQELEERLEKLLGAHRVLLTSSCTAALEMAIMTTGLGPGDEVILPSFTFVSTANAVLRAGATPVFADIDPLTGNLDPAAVERAVTPRTRAVLVVHYAGMACAMERMQAIADRHGLVVLEDAAHATNAFYLGRALGTWGALGALSFHETKDLVCGEGGALVVGRDDALARVAEIVREKGTDRSAFLRGERRKYTWVALGGSFVLSDILATIALEQFKKINEITLRKTAHAEFLLDALRPYAPFLQLPVVPDGCRPNWHLFAIQVDPRVRDWVIRALNAEGIGAAFHFVPLHSAPYAARAGLPAATLPNTDRLAAALLRLPNFATMTDGDLRDIVVAVDKVVSSCARPV